MTGSEPSLSYEREPVRTIAEKRSGIVYDRSLDEYFLASRTLPGRSVASLLLSSSFGINAVFYAASLGYMMGGWALLIQIGWAASFFLLSIFARTVYGVTSLHDLLGRRFGSTTRVVASICSIIGLMYLVGWEISIGIASIDSLNMLGGSLAASPFVVPNAGIFVGLATILAIGYSVLHGQRFNARVDVVLNICKTVAIITAVAILVVGAINTAGSGVFDALFPPFTDAIAAIGVVGFVTSLLFNLSWQFVDNSSWQSINSRANHGDREVRQTLRQSGIYMFLTIGLFGTFMGALLRHVSSVDPNAILAAVLQGSPASMSYVALAALLTLILLSVMSLVDGMVLSVAQTALVDLGIISKRIGAVKLWHARVATVVAGAVAAWGVQAFISLLGGDIFSFVYILIVVQLSLLGPVLVALMSRKRTPSMMWLSIVCGALVGTFSAVVGSVMNISILVDGAGTIASAVSVVVAGIVFGLARKRTAATAAR